MQHARRNLARRQQPGEKTRPLARRRQQFAQDGYLLAGNLSIEALHQFARIRHDVRRKIPYVVEQRLRRRRPRLAQRRRFCENGLVRQFLVVVQRRANQRRPVIQHLFAACAPNRPLHLTLERGLLLEHGIIPGNELLVDHGETRRQRGQLQGDRIGSALGPVGHACLDRPDRNFALRLQRKLQHLPLVYHRGGGDGGDGERQQVKMGLFHDRQRIPGTSQRPPLRQCGGLTVYGYTNNDKSHCQHRRAP